MSDGLSRYDGRFFIHFRHRIEDSSSLASNDIAFMRLDDRVILWLVYSSREVDILNAIIGRARHISEEDNFKWLNLVPGMLISQEGGHYFEASLTSLTAFYP